jgi:ABC-type glutathione transport system ATPase component
MAMGVIFITHDMGVVADIADRVLVMYRGEAVESGTVEEIFRAPQHPIPRRCWPRSRGSGRCAAAICRVIFRYYSKLRR